MKAKESESKESGSIFQAILIASVVVTLIVVLVGSHIMRMNSLPLF